MREWPPKTAKKSHGCHCWFNIIHILDKFCHLIIFFERPEKSITEQWRLGGGGGREHSMCLWWFQVKSAWKKFCCLSKLKNTYFEWNLFELIGLRSKKLWLLINTGYFQVYKNRRKRTTLFATFSCSSSVFSLF